jgi:hypothetical protein
MSWGNERKGERNTSQDQRPLEIAFDVDRSQAATLRVAHEVLQRRTPWISYSLPNHFSYSCW